MIKITINQSAQSSNTNGNTLQSAFQAPQPSSSIASNNVPSALNIKPSTGQPQYPTPHYPNPPLAPRFLALNQQHQQTSTNLSSQQQQLTQNQLRTNLTNLVPTSTKIQSSISLTSNQTLIKPVQVPSATTTASIIPQPASLIATLTAPNQNQQQASIQQTLPQCTLNNTLFVGNLHASLQEIDLIQVFRPFGRIVECCKKWLHFGFVKFSTEEEACHAYITLNGYRLKGRPMRLEFQNRTKKARIKAILAQAALQAANSKIPHSEQCDDYVTQSPLNNLLLNGQSQSCANIKEFIPASFKPIQPEKASFFDTERLIKFATTGYDCEPQYREPSPIEQLWSSTIKPLSIDTVDYLDDPNIQSTIRSVFLSPTSSDSGCSDEHCSTSKPQSNSSETRCETPNEYSCSEHMEFTYSHTSKQTSDDGKLNNIDNSESECDDDDGADENDSKSCISSDTSCDASLIDDLEPLEETTTNIQQETKVTTALTTTVHARGKLEFGIYCCINKTNSLFIEPEDILKPLATGDYEEYRLFPISIESSPFFIPEILY